MTPAFRAICAAILGLAPLAATAQETAPAMASPESEPGVLAVTEPESVLAAWRDDPMRVFSGLEIGVEELQYVARPLFVFADSPLDPNFIQQMELIEDGWNDLIARDVLVIADTEPSANSPVRETFRPRGFVMILVGKDGRIAQRKPSPWATREIAHAIDKLPLRQQEIRETGTLGGR
ncbi:DUF4174 domain-containing protein [Pseudoroseicyclus sp. H15]